MMCITGVGVISHFSVFDTYQRYLSFCWPLSSLKRAEFNYALDFIFKY